MQVLTILTTVATVYSVTTSTTGGLNTAYLQNLNSFGQLGTTGRLSGLKPSDQSFNLFGNSLSVDNLYGNSANYLNSFGQNAQSIYSQLTSQDFGVQTPGQTISANQLFTPAATGPTSFVNTFKSGNGFGYANSIGLGAYGQPADASSIKYSQPIQSAAPLHTRLTSSPVDVSYPTAVVSGYTPAYPPYQPASPSTASQAAITLGSGSLGITRLNNGNFALGGGSIGYGGSAPLVGPRPGPPQQIPIY